MMMPSTRRGKSSTHGASSYPGTRFLAPQPLTPRVDTAQGTINASYPINATAIGSMNGGTVTITTVNFRMLVIENSILLYGFPTDSTMVR
jgi:hypothetical protein